MSPTLTVDALEPSTVVFTPEALQYSERSQCRSVHKFGGSSLADADCYRRVTDIIGSETQPGDLIVVSAAGVTTNRLVAWLTRLTETLGVRQRNSLNSSWDCWVRCCDPTRPPSWQTSFATICDESTHGLQTVSCRGVAATP